MKEIKSNNTDNSKTKYLKDLKDGDYVLCSDNKYHRITLTPVHVPEKMYRVYFKSNDSSKINDYGYVDCSGDHVWPIHKKNSTYSNFDTNSLYGMRYKDGYYVGTGDSTDLLIHKIKKIKPVASRCVSIADTDDHLFFIKISSGESVLTHNCQQRFAAGRLNSIASRMALDSNIGTTIDGGHIGAGIVFTNGNLTNIQYYYAKSNWITKWFNDRGLDDKGYNSDNKVYSIDYSELDGEDEELKIKDEKTKIEFQGVNAEIENSVDQKFQQ